MVMLVNYILSFFWLDPVLFKVMFHKGSLVALRSHGSSGPSAFIFLLRALKELQGAKLNLFRGFVLNWRSSGGKKKHLVPAP